MMTYSGVVRVQKDYFAPHLNRSVKKHQRRVLLSRIPGMPVRLRWLMLALLGVVLAVLAVVAVRPSGTRSDESLSTPVPSGSGSGSGSSAGPAEPTTFYATRTPYPAPSDPAGVPAGLVPVFVEHLGRHGSRTSTAGEHGERAGRLWRRAAEADALTPLGARLGPALHALDAATATLGLGRLTTLGRAEQQAIGRREGERLGGLFAAAEETGGRSTSSPPAAPGPSRAPTASSPD